MPRTDILLDDDFDLAEEENTLDLVEGESDEQHVQLLVLLDKGEVRESPFAGFGIQRRLKQRQDANKFDRELTVELDNDGYNNAKATYGNNFSDFQIQIAE